MLFADPVNDLFDGYRCVVDPNDRLSASVSALSLFVSGGFKPVWLSAKVICPQALNNYTSQFQ